MVCVVYFGCCLTESVPEEEGKKQTSEMFMKSLKALDSSLFLFEGEICDAH